LLLLTDTKNNLRVIIHRKRSSLFNVALRRRRRSLKNYCSCFEFLLLLTDTKNNLRVIIHRLSECLVSPGIPAVPLLQCRKAASKKVPKKEAVTGAGDDSFFFLLFL
jgi:hypothetical protein